MITLVESKVSGRVEDIKKFLQSAEKYIERIHGFVVCNGDMKTPYNLRVFKFGSVIDYDPRTGFLLNVGSWSTKGQRYNYSPIGLDDLDGYLSKDLVDKDEFLVRLRESSRKTYKKKTNPKYNPDSSDEFISKYPTEKDYTDYIEGLYEKAFE